VAIRDLGGEHLVGAGNGLPKVKAGAFRHSKNHDEQREISRRNLGAVGSPCFGGMRKGVEQKTKQSPGPGLSIAPHPQFVEMRAAIQDISSTLTSPRSGQVMLASVWTAVMVRA
jgi:hypothetical protein